MNNMIYGINEKPKYLKEWVLYTMQMVLAVFVATVLIANICGTPISSCLFGACFGTLIYQLLTKFKSPMFISSCGATVSAVCGALAINAAISFPNADSYKTIEGICYALDKENNVIGQATANYLMVVCGGLVILIVYAIFAFLFKRRGAGFINKFLPPTIVGAITIVIGLNLAAFEVTYTHNSNVWEVIVAISVMFVVALSSHYFKGFMKTIPFLFGIGFGYIFCLILRAFGIDILDFNAFNSMRWYPDFTFLQWRASDWSWSNLIQTVLYFLPVALCAICEHISDHKTLSNIIGHDLIEEPGLNRTLIGDGVASTIGTVLCGLPNTSYGESIATIGFSRVASVWVSTAAAVCIGLLSFLGPVTAFIETIPSCVFGGCAMVLYGYIASSGLKTLINNKIDLNDNKNLTIVSVVLCVGVGGIFLFSESFKGVSLAMVLGVILNLILKNKK